MASATDVRIGNIHPAQPRWVAGHWVVLDIGTAWVVLTPAEMAAALKRGKWLKRRQQFERRQTPRED